MVGIFCEAQTVTLYGQKGAIDDQFTKSQSILPIYKYVSDSIEPYSKFGIEADAKQEWYKIKKLPIMTDCHDTGYTYIYFAGADNARSQGYLLTLVANYQRSYRDVIFYIDRNNDLDFTNDGAPDTLGFEENDFTVNLANITKPNATYALKLSRFKYGENVRYKRLLEEHYLQHSGSKIFTNANYCYREQRYNTIVADYKSGNDSFRIGLKDVNVNGLYNESEIDYWYIGPFGSTVISDNLTTLEKRISDNAFEWNGKKYVFNYIAETGDSIILTIDKQSKLEHRLKPRKKTPHFSYYNIFNEQHKLKEFKRKEVYLFFWDIQSLTDEDTLYLGLIHRELNEKIQLITLNHGDDPKKVRISFYYDRLSFPIGYSNGKIGDKYYIEDVPRGYYLGKRRRLKNDRIAPKEMYELLKKEQRKSS